MSHPDPIIRELHVKSNDTFPNSHFPVLLYKRVLDVPAFFAASKIEKHFIANGWTGIVSAPVLAKHAYHSNAHKVLAAIKGQAMILIGGENGKHVKFEKGDVLIIPAGVAHKNLSKESDIVCVTAYYGNDKVETLYGDEAKHDLPDMPVPAADPFYGENENGLLHAWKDKYPDK